MGSAHQVIQWTLGKNNNSFSSIVRKKNLFSKLHRHKYICEINNIFRTNLYLQFIFCFVYLLMSETCFERASTSRRNCLCVVLFDLNKPSSGCLIILTLLFIFTLNNKFFFYHALKIRSDRSLWREKSSSVFQVSFQASMSQIFKSD